MKSYSLWCVLFLLLAGSPEAVAQQPAAAAICNLVSRQDMQRLTGRTISSTQYIEPRAGGRVCNYNLQVKPDETGVKYMTLHVSHIVEQTAESATRYGISGLNCDYKDGGLFPLESSNGSAFTCFSYASGERNNGLSVVVIRDRRRVDLNVSFGGAAARQVDIPGFSKPLIKPLVELGGIILDRWKGS